jgi:hypothetical protein
MHYKFNVINSDIGFKACLRERAGDVYIAVTLPHQVHKFTLPEHYQMEIENAGKKKHDALKRKTLGGPGYKRGETRRAGDSIGSQDPEDESAAGSKTASVAFSANPDGAADAADDIHGGHKIENPLEEARQSSLSKIQAKRMLEM